MNIEAVRRIIESYKQHFPAINRQEIYKWQITKHFQDRWNANAADFASMVLDALATSNNLLASGNYFARRMLFGVVQKEPESVRQLFIDLYKEDADLLTRIKNFREGFGPLCERHFPGKMAYQDHRAVMVYLSLRYPEVYYLYKYEMFKDFVRKVEYPYRPVKGRAENIGAYLTLCELLNEEIRGDQELLDLHKTRIGAAEYADPEYHILTQDVIYAATFHLPRMTSSAPRLGALERLRVGKRPRGAVGVHTPVLKGSITNFIEIERARKRVGDLGELLVLEREQQLLKQMGSKKAPVHITKTEGDGLGYDVLSYDERGREKFIEVKTTTSGIREPFFVTANELERSIRNNDQFSLYRLHDLDIMNMTATFFEIQGSLADYCEHPVLFRVILG